LNGNHFFLFFSSILYLWIRKYSFHHCRAIGSKRNSQHGDQVQGLGIIFTCSLCPFYVIAFCCESAYGAIIWQVVYANRFAGLLWFVYTCLQSESNAIIIYGAQKSNRMWMYISGIFVQKTECLMMIQLRDFCAIPVILRLDPCSTVSYSSSAFYGNFMQINGPLNTSCRACRGI